MPTETEPMSAPHFEDALWQVLADAHRQRQAEGGRRRPSGPVVPLTRRPGRRTVLAGVSAAAAVATLVVALALRHDADPPDTVIDQAGVEIPADLIRRVQVATQEATAETIVHGTVTVAGDAQPAYEVWTDERSTALRVVTFDDGEVAWDTHPATVPGDGPVTESVVVNYCTGEYSPILPLPDTGPAALVLGMLESELLVEDGTEIVDGRELIRLVDAAAAPAAGIAVLELDPETGDTLEVSDEVVPMATTVWVDPHTYRPVRMDDGSYSRTYEYLPRTPENLAQSLSPPIPEGFTAVPALSDNSPDCH